jgi:hypothetical protein
MAYSFETRKKIIDAVCFDMANGISLRKACDKNKIATKVFYDWIDKDKDFSIQYARACIERADYLFEEIITIADNQGEDIIEDKDGNITINHNVINRNRLQVDSRKWALSKMFPKKYGDKLELDSTPEFNKTNLSSLTTDELLKRAEAIRVIEKPKDE